MPTPVEPVLTPGIDIRTNTQKLHEFGSQLSTALKQSSLRSVASEMENTSGSAETLDSLPIAPVPCSNLPSSSETDLATRGLPSRQAWANLLFQEIAHNKLLESQMLALTVATGIVDAVTFTTYSVFVSKQTGNTLFMASYALGSSKMQGLEKNVVVSFGVFLLGAAVFGHIGHHGKQRRRIWLLISNLIQTALVYGAAAIRYWGSRVESDSQALAIIALLSFACGGQIALALHAGLPELNTTMITGALIQLATDSRLLSLHNVGRNRRVLFFLSLLVGCFIGSAATTYVEPALGLLLMAATKTLVGLSFLFNNGTTKRREGDLEVDGGQTPFSHVLWGD